MLGRINKWTINRVAHPYNIFDTCFMSTPNMCTIIWTMCLLLPRPTNLLLVWVCVVLLTQFALGLKGILFIYYIQQVSHNIINLMHLHLLYATSVS